VEAEKFDPVLTPVEAADYLKMSPTTLAIWRCTKRYDLPYHKVGRKVRYRQSDLDAFLTGARVERGGHTRI